MRSKFVRYKQFQKHVLKVTIAAMVSVQTKYHFFLLQVQFILCIEKVVFQNGICSTRNNNISKKYIEILIVRSQTLIETVIRVLLCCCFHLNYCPHFLSCVYMQYAFILLEFRIQFANVSMKMLLQQSKLEFYCR